MSLYTVLFPFLNTVHMLKASHHRRIGERRYSSSDSEPRHCMQGDQLQALNVLAPGNTK